MNGSATGTLDLQGTFNYINPGNISQSTGTVQLDGATINTYDPGNTPNPATWTVDLGTGAVNVTNSSTLIGKFLSSANLTVNSGQNLNASGASFTNTGTVFVDHATASPGYATVGQFCLIFAWDST